MCRSTTAETLVKWGSRMMRVASDSKNRADNILDDCQAKINIASLLLRGISLVRMLSLNYDTRSQVQRPEGKREPREVGRDRKDTPQAMTFVIHMCCPSKSSLALMCTVISAVQFMASEGRQRLTCSISALTRSFAPTSLLRLEVDACWPLRPRMPPEPTKAYRT